LHLICDKINLSNLFNFLVFRNADSLKVKLMGNTLKPILLPSSSIMTTKPVTFILGATGTGKTELSIALAKKFNGEVINADAMQIYKGLDIVTNKVGDTPHKVGDTPHKVGDTPHKVGDTPHKVGDVGDTPHKVGNTPHIYSY